STEFMPLQNRNMCIIVHIYGDAPVYVLGELIMSKSNVFGWLKQGWSQFLDPAREERVNGFVQHVHRALSKQRQDFDFHRTAAELGILSDDLPVVVRRLFAKCIEKAWDDQELTDKENKSLKWIAQKIGLPELEARRVMMERALDEFERVFDATLADGRIDDQ